jgi:hypothetical protein
VVEGGWLDLCPGLHIPSEQWGPGAQVGVGKLLF